MLHIIHWVITPFVSCMIVYILLYRCNWQSITRIMLPFKCRPTKHSVSHHGVHVLSSSLGQPENAWYVIIWRNDEMVWRHHGIKGLWRHYSPTSALITKIKKLRVLSNSRAIKDKVFSGKSCNFLIAKI